MVRDVIFGARQLRRQAAFAAAAIASLALGIGLTTTLFSIVNGVLFKSAPVASRGTLVELYTGLEPSVVWALVMGQGGRLAALGIALGVVASAGVARLAKMVPALTAAGVNPAKALRGE
jgi:hypothetical protein